MVNCIAEQMHFVGATLKKINNYYTTGCQIEGYHIIQPTLIAKMNEFTMQVKNSWKLLQDDSNVLIKVITRSLYKDSIKVQLPKGPFSKNTNQQVFSFGKKYSHL
jgi:hypothetical protein